MRPKTSPRGGAQRLAVEDAQEVFEQGVVEFGRSPWAAVEEGLEVALDGVHGVDEGGAEVGAFGQRLSRSS
jgi:hypothetical protein